MRRTRQIVSGLTRLARRPQSRSPRPITEPEPPESRPEPEPIEAHPEGCSPDDPLADAPRVKVNPAVVSDLEALRAADHPVVLTDGAQELVVLVPVEQYRALQATLARLRAEQSAQQTVSAARTAVLDPAELDALLTDWDHSRGPGPVGPPTADRVRPVRISDPPQRRLSRR